MNMYQTFVKLQQYCEKAYQMVVSQVCAPRKLAGVPGTSVDPVSGHSRARWWSRGILVWAAKGFTTLTCRATLGRKFW